MAIFRAFGPFVFDMPPGGLAPGKSTPTFCNLDPPLKGGTVTFTPTDSTAEVPAAGSVTFTFDVNGLLGGAPTACAVNDHPCD